MNILIQRFRILARAIKIRIKQELRRFCYLLAEYESCRIKPGDFAIWRARQLLLSGVTHGTKFYVGRGFWLQNGHRFIFGERCSLGEFARIIDHGEIRIGDDFIAATGLQINSGTHDPVSMVPSVSQISIGNRVWCGANVTIIAGASIGDDVVIGAGSLVRSVVPSGCVIAGVPAKIIRTLDRKSEKPIWKWTD